MPLFDKLRDHRLKSQQEKLDRRERELLELHKVSQEELEKRRKLDAYELARKEKEIANRKAKLKAQQDSARIQALEREEEARRSNAAWQAALAKQKEEELEKYKRRYDDTIRQLEADQLRNDREAQLRLAAERKRREHVQQELWRERQQREAALREEEAQKLAARDKIERQKAQMKLEEEQRREQLLQAEEKRKRDELLYFNSAKALQELRDLIRTRYELDMNIWSRRDVAKANRDLIEKKMAKADEILLLIRSRVENWNAESDWDEVEWSYAAEVKERLLSGGKRIWADNPPWPKENEVKGNSSRDRIKDLGDAPPPTNRRRRKLTSAPDKVV